MRTMQSHMGRRHELKNRSISIAEIAAGGQGSGAAMECTWKPEDLEEFRAFLRVLAEIQLTDKVRGKLDPSDIVQQTMIEAHSSLPRFAGQSRAELAGWMKRILGNVLTDATRALGAAKRDWAREQPIDRGIDASSARLEAWLQAAHSTPSQRVVKHEQLLHMAQALTKLPEAERMALVLRHCQGWTLTRIAEQLHCSAPTVIAHLERGAEHMRKLMPGWGDAP